jgi:hypothetical protein
LSDVGGEPEDPKTIPGLSPTEIAALDDASVTDVAKSLLEARQLSSGKSLEELANDSRNNEHARNERFRDHFERIAICGLWVICAMFLIVGLTWFWHLLTPQSWHWLGADEVAKLQNVVTGGIIASIAAGHIKKRLGN